MSADGSCLGRGAIAICAASSDSLTSQSLLGYCFIAYLCAFRRTYGAFDRELRLTPVLSSAALRFDRPQYEQPRAAVLLSPTNEDRAFAGYPLWHPVLPSHRIVQ